MVTIYRSIKNKVDYIPVTHDIKYVLVDDNSEISIENLSDKTCIVTWTPPNDPDSEYGCDFKRRCVKKTY